MNLEYLKDFHRRRVQVLADSGADVIAFETVPNKLEAQVLVTLVVGHFNNLLLFPREIMTKVPTLSSSLISVWHQTITGRLGFLVRSIRDALFGCFILRVGICSLRIIPISTLLAYYNWC